jgi:hypothetical protein
VQRLGKNALCAKSDIKSALRLLPIYPGSFDLLGLQLNGNFYIDKMLPMGLCNFSQHYSHPYNVWDIILIELIHVLLIQPTISLEMPVPSQGHYGFHSFPVVD